MTQPINGAELNQTDYLKLFMQELTYQDPLQPIDNREFMAQMAQFSALQEAKATNENLVSLAAMTSANQSLALLGKKITLVSGETGTVTKVQFFKLDPPKLTVLGTKGEISEIELKEVQEVEK